MSVCLFVCLLVTFLSSAKTAELIKMLFEVVTLMGPRNHVLDGVEITSGRGNFLGKMWQPIVKYRVTLP